MAALIQVPPVASAPIFGDPEYREIRKQICSLPISDDVLSVLESWDLLCKMFEGLAEAVQPLNDRIINWNPTNTETEKVKELWLRIYGSFQDHQTDHRESVLANLFILQTAIKMHSIKELNGLGLLQNEGEKVKDQTIKEKIGQFWPKGTTYEQAKNYFSENWSALNGFSNELFTWIPANTEDHLIRGGALSLLRALSDPRGPNYGTRPFQESLRELRRLLESNVRTQEDQKGM